MRLRSLPIAIALASLVWFAASNPTHADVTAPTASPPVSPSPAQTSTAAPGTAGPSPSASPSPLSNPFPSTQPSAAVGSNGYVAAGYVGGTAGGGSIHPQPGSTSTPTVFPGSTSVSGFWIDALGRLGPSYLASLQYENYKASGGDRPLVSYEQLAGVYQAPLSPWGFGVSLMSAQRSTVNANMNGVGVGFELMPNLGRPLSFFSSGFFYPHVASLGASSSFFIGDLGLHIAPAKRGGFFVRVGVSTHCCWPASTSPRSDTGPTIGVGTTF